ncbi:tol-pal system-associated acyl-CoA thioesterase [Halothiobacillus sp. DCM-1]|uniref:tol-pal system-associated acyl-CoA thioesterase n=1 Tax=Halothiobacillus sp. DCM-1 TaxID=3112558 RepID=UPI003248EE1A
MSDLPFEWPVRIYYEDTDAAGVVYYANYLKFFERARTEWLRAQGFEQDQLRAEFGIVFVVSRVQVEYKQAAKFNETLSVSCQLLRQSAVAMDFAQQALRTSDRRLMSEAAVQIVCVDAERFKPKPIPQALRSCFL